MATVESARRAAEANRQAALLFEDEVQWAYNKLKDMDHDTLLREVAKLIVRCDHKCSEDSRGYARNAKY